MVKMIKSKHDKWSIGVTDTQSVFSFSRTSLVGEVKSCKNRQATQCAGKIFKVFSIKILALL